MHASIIFLKVIQINSIHTCISNGLKFIVPFIHPSIHLDFKDQSETGSFIPHSSQVSALSLLKSSLSPSNSKKLKSKITPSNSNADFDAANLINILTSDGPDQVDIDSDDENDDEEEDDDDGDDDDDDDDGNELGRQSKSGKSTRKARKSLKEFPKSDLSKNYVTLYIHMPNDHFQSKSNNTYIQTYIYIHTQFNTMIIQ